MEAVAHGVSQGAISEIRGGDFKTNFMSGFSIGNKGYGGVMSRTAIMGTVGGTANGARTAVFVHLFNSEADVKKIINKTHKYVDNLVANGYRLKGSGSIIGNFNNILSTYGKNYLGCIHQSKGLIHVLSSLEFDDVWSFQMNYPHPVHKNVMAISNNLNDPNIILDPWKNEIEYKEKIR